jgi:hypothetical protein
MDDVEVVGTAPPFAREDDRIKTDYQFIEV